MSDIEVSTNSSQVLNELSQIEAASKRLSQTNAQVYAQSTKDTQTWSGALSGLSSNYAALNAAVTGTSGVLTSINTLMSTGIAQVTAYQTAINAWNASLMQTVSLMTALNGLVTMNSAIMLQNMTQVIANTLNLTLYNGVLMLQTLLTDIWTASTLLAVFSMQEFAKSISSVTDALVENSVQSVISSLLTGLNALAVLLATKAFEGMNGQLEKMSELYDKLNVNCGVNSALLLLNVAALLLHQAMLEKENKALTSNTTRRTNNNKRTAAGIGLKGMEIGAMFPFPANVAMAPTLGAAFTAAAFAIVKMGTAALATGGIVNAPTMALVGEGRYPEAVVPLGDSPQFAGMKTEIANAVLQGIAAMQGNGGNGEIVLNLDGELFARAIIPKIDRENRRRGCKIQYNGV